MSLYRAEGKEVEYTADEGSTRRRGATPNIPPYVENWELIGITPVTEPITLYAMSPHMHLRGKSLKWVVTYPDGRDQVILNVPKFDFNWQFNYELAEPLHIPAGSKIIGIGVYDNSPKNRWNPAPHLPVYWSEQSWDEMYQAFTEYSVDSQLVIDVNRRRRNRGNASSGTRHQSREPLRFGGRQRLRKQLVRRRPLATIAAAGGASV